jgi:hypothetical protein
LILLIFLSLQQIWGGVASRASEPANKKTQTQNKKAKIKKERRSREVSSRVSNQVQGVYSNTVAQLSLAQSNVVNEAKRTSNQSKEIVPENAGSDLRCLIRRLHARFIEGVDWLFGPP